MYLLLLVFGGLLGIAGVVLAASGMSLREGTFDAALLTPGIVAAAGGLLLIGLGAGLRTLQRIERTLAFRPMQPALPIPEAAKAAESIDTPREPARIPFAPKPSHEAESGVVLGDKLPETTPGMNKTAPPIPAIPVAVAHDTNVKSTAQRSGKNGNGAAGIRAGLRLSAGLRPTSPGERQSEPVLDALWPKGPRPSRPAEAASAPIAQSPTAIQSRQSTEATNAVISANNPDSAAVSVLKSGIVNGMPYTLYSDGSIEAQLPEGTLRFGSITELRNHIEQSA
jgi:hypothetical protein